MRKSEAVEGVILLLLAVLLLPIWMAFSGRVQLPLPLLRVLSFLQYPVVVVLGVIFVRRLRRVIRAFRGNQKRPGRF